MVLKRTGIDENIGSPTDYVGDILKRYQAAKSRKEMWSGHFEECYEYALPQRESFYEEQVAKKKNDKIFDETAVVGVQEFASRLQAGMVPTFARWADLRSGTEIPPSERLRIDQGLDQITDYIFEILQNSNFNQEVHESFMDLAVGTGALLVEDGDANNPIRFKAVPLAHLVLETGPNDDVDSVFRTRWLKAEDIQNAYPKAIIPDTVLQKMNLAKNPVKKCEVLEVVKRDWLKPNEYIWKHCVILKEHKALIFEQSLKGDGANPWIVFRWSKAAGEVYGRGPLLNALPAIKTCNLTVELILENAQMSIAGMYQVDDDGVINPDTIQLVPGSIIPRSPGSTGLTPITPPGNFDVAQLILQDMRQNIKKALYNEQLGDPNKTPATATEITERMADLSRQIGSAFGRLQAEFVNPILRRVIYLLRKQGRIELPMLNNREIKIKPVSPLAQAQNNQDVSIIDRFLDILGARFGPESLNMFVKTDVVAGYIARKLGLPGNIIRTAEEQQQIMAQMQQMAQQQQQPPQE
jgi:hypothetical protein